MKHQIYDLRRLSDSEYASIARNEVDSMLEGQFCTLCNGGFIGREEKDNAIISGKNPMSYAHDYCWNQMKRGNYEQK